MGYVIDNVEEYVTEMGQLFDSFMLEYGRDSIKYTLSHESFGVSWFECCGYGALNLQQDINNINEKHGLPHYDLNIEEI